MKCAPVRIIIHTTIAIILSPIILIVRTGNHFKKKKYTSLEKSGSQICLQNLKINSNSGYGISSSSSKFKGIWTRDSFFASWGLISIKQYSSIKRTLMILNQYQRKDGLIPFRISKGSMISKAFGMTNKKQIHKTYHLDINGSAPLDCCSQFIILMHMYASSTKDTILIDKYNDKINLAYKWLIQQSNNGLLHQENYGGWQNTLDIKGPILYTNILYYRAIYCYEKINKLEHKKSNRIKKLIRIKYWNSKYFKMTPSNDNFSLVGNALAILYDLVTPKEADLIIKERLKMGDTFFVRPNRDTYTIKNLSISLNLLGLSDLHNNLIHPWANLFFMSAMLKHSDLYIPLVVKWFEEFQMVIKKYGNIYACYNKNKKPINRFFYENCDSTQLSGIYLFFENILEKYTANSQKKNYEVSSPVKKNNCRVS